MSTVKDILEFLETLAPRSMKMEWDNVGLLCGSKAAKVTTIVVALDPFEGVCREAAEIGAQLIVTHHPLIFRAPSAITDETAVGRSIMFLCREGISAINAHTNLDQAAGGVNDVLAEKLGLRNVQIINPVDGVGLLRCGEVATQSMESFLATVKEKLGCDGLRYVNSSKAVQKVAVGGGACAGEMMEAFAAGCDTFVTADVKYNQFWDAYDLGMNLIDAGHFQTENPVVTVLAEKIAAAFPEIRVEISKTHGDCMKYY